MTSQVTQLFNHSHVTYTENTKVYKNPFKTLLHFCKSVQVRFCSPSLVVILCKLHSYRSIPPTILFKGIQVHFGFCSVLTYTPSVMRTACLLQGRWPHPPPFPFQASPWIRPCLVVFPERSQLHFTRRPAGQRGKRRPHRESPPTRRRAHRVRRPGWSGRMQALRHRWPFTFTGREGAFYSPALPCPALTGQDTDGPCGCEAARLRAAAAAVCGQERRHYRLQGAWQAFHGSFLNPSVCRKKAKR